MHSMETSEQRPVERGPLEQERRPEITESVRASNAERNVVAEYLRDAYADGRLDADEFDVRIHQALVAKTRADLEQLLADLGPRAGLDRVPDVGVPATPPAAPDRSYSFTVAIMGGADRRGRFSVPEESTAFALCGGINLDLRAATLTNPVTTIRAIAIMGGIDIVVPPGVRVEMSGLPIMGGADDKVDDADLPSTAPLVRVQYVAIMGGVTVKTRAPNKGRRERRHELGAGHRELHRWADE